MIGEGGEPKEEDEEATKEDERDGTNLSNSFEFRNEGDPFDSGELRGKPRPIRRREGVGEFKGDPFSLLLFVLLLRRIEVDILGDDPGISSGSGDMAAAGELKDPGKIFSNSIIDSC